MSARYYEDLDQLGRVKLRVDFTTARGEVVDYVVVLLLAGLGGMETIRVFDSSHGFNEMHRYTRTGGKQTGTKFHSGSLWGRAAGRYRRRQAEPSSDDRRVE